MGKCNLCGYEHSEYKTCQAARIYRLVKEIEELKAVVDVMYRVCLNATGAYKALRMVGADKHLPGITNCEAHLEKAIKLAEEFKALKHKI